MKWLKKDLYDLPGTGMCVRVQQARHVYRHVYGWSTSPVASEEGAGHTIDTEQVPAIATQLPESRSQKRNLSA